MIWIKSGILKELARLHQSGKEMSYNRLAKSRQSLVSAAAYHFGSYRRAVQQAGIDYAVVLRRPRWTRQNIIAIIKSARRRGEDLNWSAIIKRRDELGKAGFASLQKRLFGQWVRALQAAGVDGDEVALYRHWDRNSIAFELRQRSQDGEELSSGALQADDPGLHAASLRHFKSFDAALRAARLDPEKIRRRHNWDKSSVIRAIKSEARSRKSMSDTRIRRQQPALYGAAVRLFGSYIRARAAAGIKFKSRRR
jgi:hypothetical protein